MSGADDTRRFDERFEDLAAAYALGALTDEERREFEARLAERPDLQAEVEELGASANLLALAPQEHEPSPDLRRNLLRSVGGTPEAHPAAWETSGGRRVTIERLLGPGGLAAAAAVVAVVGLLAWALSLQNANEDLRAEVGEQRREAESLRAEAGRGSHELRGSGTAETAHGELVLTEEGRAVLVAEGLPPAPAGKVYEAWVLHDGVPVPAGLFEPREGGATAATVEGTLEGAEAVAVTVEPEGGSPMPTSDPVLTASLA